MLRFVDLFAGLGGFHLALKQLGHECVFASEIDEVLRGLYEKNFGILPYGDIRSVNVADIPPHDILCAGFPCQPFSKAGRQEGFDCPRWGDLFDYVIGIVKLHSPSFIMLENVANLKKHNNGQTWERIKSTLETLGYVVDEKQLSPHRFGIPQIRECMFIVGSRKGLDHFTWPTENTTDPISIRTILDTNPPEARTIPVQVLENLQVWQKFIELYPSGEQLPSFPIWTMEFGATYPFENSTPFAMKLEDLQNFRGNYGTPLLQLSRSEIMNMLPSHARREQKEFPKWKVQFIRQNRELYARHKCWIDDWLPYIKRFPPSFQKLEWNCKGEQRRIWNYIIQIRASGVRVKRPLTSPSLVSMTTTQIPIVGWEQRYMTLDECLKLQCMECLTHLPTNQSKQIRAIGNAVNVRVAENVARALTNRN